MSEGRKRPNPAQWVWYTVGGRLPEQYRTWVLHDVTARSWIWRHAARCTLMLAPLFAICLVLPLSWGLRFGAFALVALVGYFYSFAYMDESAEQRLAKHGYPYGLGKQIRAEANAEETEERNRRYIAMYRS